MKARMELSFPEVYRIRKWKSMIKLQSMVYKFVFWLFSDVERCNFHIKHFLYKIISIIIRN